MVNQATSIVQMFDVLGAFDLRWNINNLLKEHAETKGAKKSELAKEINALNAFMMLVNPSDLLGILLTNDGLMVHMLEIGGDMLMSNGEFANRLFGAKNFVDGTVTLTHTNGKEYHISVKMFCECMETIYGDVKRLDAETASENVIVEAEYLDEDPFDGKDNISIAGDGLCGYSTILELIELFGKRSAGFASGLGLRGIVELFEEYTNKRDISRMTQDQMYIALMAIFGGKVPLVIETEHYEWIEDVDMFVCVDTTWCRYMKGTDAYIVKLKIPVYNGDVGVGHYDIWVG